MYRIVGMREIYLQTNVGCILVLKDLRYFSDIRLNLISIDKLDDEGHSDGEERLKLTRDYLVIAIEEKPNTL